MSILLRQITLWGNTQPLDIAIERKQIVSIGKPPPSFVAKKVIEGKNLVAIPGLFDLGVYLREPGYEHKATIASETKAAAAGGVTTLVAMPETQPIVDSPTVVELIQNRSRSCNLANILVVGAITKALKGKELSEMGALKGEGCIAVGNLNQPFTSLLVMKRAFEYASGLDFPIFFHPQSHSLSQNGCAHEGLVSIRLGLAGIPYSAETAAIGECLAIAEDTGAAVHFCRLSSARSVELIRQAQKKGIKVSADVAAHQLLLTEDDIVDFDPHCHVLPPLRSEQDRKALIKGLNDGVIQAICSDHQPHDLSAKLMPFPSSAPGISSIETLLPLVLRLLDRGEIKPQVAIAAMTENPAKIVGVDAGILRVGGTADICIFDPHKEWQLEAKNMLSNGRNTPFDGQQFKGKVMYTIYNGKVTYANPS